VSLSLKTNNENGRKLALAVGIYTIVKAILNMILGGGFGDIIVGVFIAAALYTGLQYVNYVTAGYLVYIALIHLPANISHISDNWIYLIEGIADIACAALIFTNSDIKEHFTNKWDELPELFNK